jgi:formylglycine-generating enzyme required for sulfatase activity
LQPAIASNKNVNWSSSNTGVASVEDGTVTALALGDATITLSTEEGNYKASCAVSVLSVMPEVSGMVWIRAGTFTMGSPSSEPEHENNETQHQVTLTDGFYMGKYLVTQEFYLAVTGENYSRFKEADGDNPANRPVENVSWYEAIIFCNMLSRSENLSPAYTMYRSDAPNADRPVNRWTDIPANWSTDPADWGRVPIYDTTIRWDAVRMVEDSNGYRLPTEAQWEYACRAGTVTPFNTGDNITTNQANYDGNYPYNNNPKGRFRERTTEVNTFVPNAWGLYDMHGNVWEWCWDWYAYYRSGSQTDPTGALDGIFRILRGGSWVTDANYVRSAFRYGEYANEWSSDIGFRLVRP